MPKMKVEMMMLIRLNFISKRAIMPSTMSQLMRMGEKPKSVFLMLKRKLTKSTRNAKAMESHCRMLKSVFSCSRVSVV